MHKNVLIEIVCNIFKMKRNSIANSPRGECRYAEKCYRKNPVHFQEYGHKHLMDILNQTPEGTDFEIPQHLLACREILTTQLKILVDLNIIPNKKVKTDHDNNQSNSNNNFEDSLPNSSSTNRNINNEGNRNLIDEGNKNLTNGGNRNVINEGANRNTITIRTPQDINNDVDAGSSSTISIKTPQEINADAGTSSNNDFSFSTSRNSVSPRPEKTDCDLEKLDVDRKKHLVVEKDDKKKNLVVEKDDSNVRRSPSPRSRRKVDPKEIFNVVAPQGKFAEKLAKASPYNFFLTTVTANRVTHDEPLSVTFTELLDKSLGELESSVQINFMVDLSWLLAHYYVSGNRDTQLLILYGEETDDLIDINKKSKNIQTVQVKMGSPFGKHHTKMSLLGYKDGSMRVVVSTANLYEDDWENRTQGLWVSPRLPAIETVWDTRVGESETGFRDDLLRYLISYKIPQLQTWIARIRKTDFSSINVFLVASIPGSHRGLDGTRYGHKRLAALLSSHANAAATSKDYVVAQSSSIGSLGPNKDSWVGGEFLTSTTRTKPRGTSGDASARLLEQRPLIKMIYPSLANVRASHDGLMGGGCLPYNVKTHSKQNWLVSILHQWRAKSRNRTKAMPHIKSYCRVNIKDDKILGLHWFLVTSANLSKAAWGVVNKTTGGSLCGDPPLRIMSYEAGVLFLPQFVIQKDFLPLQNDSSLGPIFPMPFDLPLTPYNPDDTPFFMDLLSG
ncbi:probable tyrosyl-DNA phosphodiesterase [Ctenocephalides felis]|uniref:probable tyrosyl-DNA phosphodiesterase n=1 Tax=Ctenocephalides felis TaxID=7515 RepID=UPI000E6E56D1|nr:probable tyrosyl-DNA phosphodiesterase [Ctenocephalides felis]